MENQIVEADYTVLQDRTLPVIVSEIKTIEAQVYKTVIDGAAEIGKRLIEAKEQVGHGEWSNWCNENLNYTQRQAQNFIQIHENYGDENSPYSKAKTSSFLGISKALALLQVPENEVEKFVEEHPVDDMTVKELEKEIRKEKEEKDSLQSELNNIQSERASMQAEIEQLKKLGAYPEEIDQLKDKLEKQTEKEKKLKEDLKKEKDARKEAIQDALAKESERLSKAAEEKQAEEMKSLEQERAGLIDQLKAAQKKAELSTDEDIAAFKTKSDLLQNIFADILVSIESVKESNSDQAEKMQIALKAVLETLIERLEV